MNIQSNNINQRPLSIMDDILSLTNSTLLTADMILLCTKTLYPVHGSHSPFHTKCVFPTGEVPLSPYPTSCTPTISNLYRDSSLETVIREPALYKLLMCQVPNLMSIFHHLGCLSKESIHVRGLLIRFVTNLLFTVTVLLAPRPTPNLENQPLSFSAAAYSVYSLLPSIAGVRPSTRIPRTRHAVMTVRPTSRGNSNS
jgi:hypothetical protein